MGVPLFFRWVEDNNKQNLILINDGIEYEIDYLMIDTNCLLHPCVAYIVSKYKNNEIANIKCRNDIEEIIWNKIEEYINDLINRLKPKFLFIAIDGVAPMGKIIQQRQRRYKNSNVEANEMCPFQSIELTPGTPYMERLDKKFNEYCKKLNIKYKYSSCFEESEGEHKILNYIKNEVDNNKNIVIYGLDADLLFLSLTDNLKHNLFVMREKQFFDKKEEDKNLMDNVEDIEYNYVNINEFHKIINSYGISSNKFVLLCYLLGNDFLPSLLSLNIKRKGIDHIINAYNNVKKTKRMELIENNKINHNFLIELFKNIEWTEKKVFNYNTTFNNENEYYRYYLNKDINVEKDKKLMVKKYIETIEWCYIYYTDTCISWKHYYNFDNPPSIKDIIKYYPKNVNIDKCQVKLKPIEQLILVIPPKFYSFIMNENILNKILTDKNFLKIKYLFPNNFDVDKNKEFIEWKQHIILPFINYEYYLSIIQNILK